MLTHGFRHVSWCRRHGNWRQLSLCREKYSKVDAYILVDKGAKRTGSRAGL